MTENSSNFDLDREDAFSTISCSQFSLVNERPETIVGSTSNLELHNELTKQIVKNTLLENENKTLIEEVKMSNKMIKCLNEKVEEINLKMSKLDGLDSDIKQLKEKKIEEGVEMNKKFEDLNSKINKLDKLPSELNKLKEEKIKGDAEINKKVDVLTSDLKQFKLKSDAKMNKKFEEINLKINKLDKLPSELNKLKEDKLKSDKVNSKNNEKINILTSKMEKLNKLPSELNKLKEEKIESDIQINENFDEVLLEINKLKEDKIRSDELIVDLNSKINDFIENLENNECLIEINKKIKELSFNLGILLKMIVAYKYVENNWKYINSECCDNKCVNNNHPNGLCSKGNGFVQIKNKTEIVYINCIENGKNIPAIIKAENYFNKPIDELIKTFTLYYSEVKLIFEKDEVIEIGLRSRNHFICLYSTDRLIFYSFKNNLNYIKLPSFTYKTNDIIGCGLVYPPPSELNNKLLPYIFFTQNGKQIGKAILLKGDYEFFKPYVGLNCCSAETNFGNNPYIYDVSKHFLITEFYNE